jgi:hypothetical protein
MYLLHKVFRRIRRCDERVQIELGGNASSHPLLLGRPEHYLEPMTSSRQARFV